MTDGRAAGPEGDAALDAEGWSGVWGLDFEGTVRTACATSHDVVDPADGDAWVMAIGGEAMTSQGWKLHVSATVAEAAAVLDAVLPVLAHHGVSFKAIRRPSELQSLNSGMLGASQVGKFVAVYPSDGEVAVAVARDLTAATAGMAGPQVPSDVPIPGGLVFYRFGAYEARTVRVASGALHPAILGPDGHLVPDIRSRRRARPAWAVDPFVAAGLVDDSAARQQLVAGRFLQVSPLSRSARGEVWLGVDVHVGQPVVIKSARRHSAASSSGRDAFDRSLVEGGLLELLDGTGVAPGHVATIIDGDEAAVVMEWIDGSSLTEVLTEAVLAGTPLDHRRVARWLRSIIEALERIHEAGWVYRDLKMANVLVADDRAFLIDFDFVARIGDDSEDAMGGTLGYMPPELSARYPADPASDVYGVGAILYGLLTGTEPVLAPDVADLTTRPIALLAPAADPVLSALCLSCLVPDPAERPTLARIRSVLDEAAALEERSNATPVGGPAAGGAGGPDDDAVVARRLVDTLVADGRHRWSRPDPMSGAALVLDVYAGLAGVVLVLAEAVRSWGEPSHRDALADGTEQLVAETLRSIDAEGGLAPGLHNGLAGIAVVVAAAAAVLDEPDVAEVGSALLLDCAGSDAAGLLEAVGPDLMVGAAGVARAHLELWRRSGGVEHLQRATEVAEVLVSTATQVDGSVNWRLPAEMPVLGGAAAIGYGHGAVGVADVLFDVSDATGDDRFEATAIAALAWAVGLGFVFGDGGLDWGRTDQLDGIAPHWCHGAAGIAPVLARGARRAAAADGVVAARFEDAAWRAGRATVALRSTGPTLCHGLAGNVVCLRRLARELGEAPLAHDHHLALLRAFLIDDDGWTRARGDVPDQMPLGLMTGAAGVALALLPGQPAGSLAVL